ncbi:uncharacterized protein LOC141607690 [Silene latifolia]|uniref:uncharacterized protein LOC141607690 n=1 Tax=Silene latifolia TaxID=37657 RepID=UPI003D77D501
MTSPWPFSTWGIDIIGKVNPSRSGGHCFILVAIDYFTKWVEAKSYKVLKAKQVAQFIQNEIICRYGTPHELISDNRTHFQAETEITFALWGYRTSIRTATGATLYYLVYGMEAVQPIELEGQLYQKRIERAFNKKVKPRKIKEGDLVLKSVRALLLVDPRGKFKANWAGPYLAKKILTGGAVRLTDLDGNDFSNPTNLDQLKKYYP